MDTSRPLRRSLDDRQIAGVCGGLAEFFGVDATLLRVVYVLATIFTAFAGVMVYFLLWILVPEREY